MEITRARVLGWAGYFIYGLLVFSLVFAARYYVRQTDPLARQAVSGLAGVTVEFPYLEPQLFPPRLTLDYLRVLDKKTKAPLLVLKDADIRISMLSLMLGKLRLSVKSRAYGGLLDFDVTTGMFFNANWLKVGVRTDMIELDTIPQVVNYDKSLKGYATMDVSLSGDWSKPLELEGDFLVQLDGLDMENRFPVVKGARLAGYKILLDGSSDNGVLSIRDFDVLSQDGISLKTEGTITMDKADFSKSGLDLSGKFLGPLERLATSILDPKAVEMMKKKQAVPVKVTGVMGNAQILMR
jgi:type II secretion system protein N